MSSPTEDTVVRPLSPHLQIYKPQLTSVLSILHRITGVALSFGLVVLVAWLASLSNGVDCYAQFVSYAQSLAGRVVLFGMTFAFFFHMTCGIRHLLWGSGLFLDLPGAYKTGHLAMATTAILTLCVWLKILGVSL